jgi:sugar O-acyltransferase (sialic acid O-acetyltransferase NeuD family)
MNDILLIGGGGHCESVIDVVEQEGRYNIIGIIDRPELLGKNLLGYQVIGNDYDLSDLVKSCSNAIITVGQIHSPLVRIKLFKTISKLGYCLPTIISPRSYISKYAKIGLGSVVMHDVIINSNALIGDNCILNTKSLLEHGCKIGDHCHISTNAVINGNTIIGQGCFIGSGAITKEGSRVQDNFFAKAGSVLK